MRLTGPIPQEAQPSGLAFRQQWETPSIYVAHYARGRELGWGPTSLTTTVHQALSWVALGGHPHPHRTDQEAERLKDTPPVTQLVNPCPAFPQCWAPLTFSMASSRSLLWVLHKIRLFSKIRSDVLTPPRAGVACFCQCVLSGPGHCESGLVQLHLFPHPEHPATNYTRQRPFPSNLAGGGVWRRT